MSSLLLPRRFYSQPQGAVTIDWENQLIKKANVFAVMHPSLGLIRRTGIERLEPQGGGFVGANQFGLALSANGASTDGFFSATDFGDINYNTVFSGYMLGSGGEGIIASRWTAPANYGGYLSGISGGHIYTYLQNSTDGARSVNTASAISDTFSYGFSWSAGAPMMPYLNGRPDVGTTDGWGPAIITPYIQSVNAKLSFCRQTDSGGYGSGTTKVNLAVYGYAKWSDDIQQEFDANPWQIFKVSE